MILLRYIIFPPSVMLCACEPCGRGEFGGWAGSCGEIELDRWNVGTTSLHGF